jgi:hypothetical protein
VSYALNGAQIKLERYPSEWECKVEDLLRRPIRIDTAVVIVETVMVIET